MLDLIIVSPREQGDMNYIYIMEKKEYLSPEMKEVEINSESSLLTASAGQTTCDCETDQPCDCEQD